jgi:hypothetical protein
MDQIQVGPEDDGLALSITIVVPVGVRLSLPPITLTMRSARLRLIWSVMLKPTIDFFLGFKSGSRIVFEDYTGFGGKSSASAVSV